MSKLKDIQKKVDNIINGWKNFFFRTPEIEALARERLEVCVQCEYFNSLNVCSLCYCPGAGKARSPNDRCKANKWKDGWGKVVPEELTQIKELLQVPRPMGIFRDQQRGGEITEEEILRVVEAAKDSNFTFNSQEELERYRYLESLLP